MRRAALVLGVAGCQLVTHAHDYTIPDYGICSVCGYRTDDLRRPPCPPRANTSDASGRYVYAWRHVSLGGSPDSFTSPAYDCGYDEDCSTRGDGVPAACAPVFDLAPAQLIPIPAWEPLPHGIDNSLGQRVIGPLLAFGRNLNGTLDVDQALSQSLEHGDFGEIVVLDGWNGGPDDDDVTVTFVGSSAGVQAKPARWNGEDVWVPNSTVAGYPHLKSYVSGGVLVADARGLGEEDSTYSLGGATFALQSRLLVRAASITPSSMRIVTYGRVDLADLLPQVPELAKFLSGGQTCDSGDVAHVLCTDLPDLLRGAADLPRGEAPTPGQPCEAISLAAVADAYPAKLPP